MSDKKVDTKIIYDENTDSGFISGPIDRLPGDDDEERGDDNVTSKSSELVNLDSGLDLSLSQDLEALNLGKQTFTVSARPDSKERSDKVTSESEELVNLDSGLDLDLSEPTYTTTAQPPKVVVTDVHPLERLFQQDDDGDTQLHIAAVHGCQKSVGTLVNVCPDRHWLDITNDFGHTALHLAVLSGDAVVTRMLVQVGASIGVRDLDGNTPLHLATIAKHVESLQALLMPTDKRQRKISEVLNMKNYDGQTCVHLAASSGHLDTLKKLVYYGADINAREGLAGWTPLHISARRGDYHMTQYLERCPGIAIRARDYAGRTPWRLARRAKSFTSKEGQRLFKSLLQDSDSESETDDEDCESDDDDDFEDPSGDEQFDEQIWSDLSEVIEVERRRSSVDT